MSQISPLFRIMQQLTNARNPIGPKGTKALKLFSAYLDDQKGRPQRTRTLWERGMQIFPSKKRRERDRARKIQLLQDLTESCFQIVLKSRNTKELQILREFEVGCEPAFQENVQKGLKAAAEVFIQENVTSSERRDSALEKVASANSARQLYVYLKEIERQERGDGYAALKQELDECTEELELLTNFCSPTVSARLGTRVTETERSITEKSGPLEWRRKLLETLRLELEQAQIDGLRTGFAKLEPPILLQGAAVVEEADTPILEYTFKGPDDGTVHGTVLGTDVVQRIPVVTKSIETLTATRTAIREKLRSGVDKEEEKRLNIRLDCIRLALQNLTAHRTQSKEKTWINSNYHRDFLRTITIGKRTPQELINQKFRELNRRQILAAPVNMRAQYLKRPDDTTCAHSVRLGVISDHRNGFISLPELLDLQKDHNARDAKIKELKRLQKQYTGLQHAGIQYAIDEISSPDLLNRAIIEREFILEQQTLLLLEEQLTQNCDRLREKGTFSVSHVSLLNPQSNEINETGWCHNEATEIRDMRAAFKNLEGKQVLFHVKTGKGSYVDPDGVIHIAKPEKMKGDIHKITIDKAVLVNISVQGHTKVSRLQTEINGNALDAFIEIALKNYENDVINQPRLYAFREKLAHVQGRIKRGESSYKLVELLEEALIEGGIIFSHGCLSAKDRTGYVAYRTIYRQLLREMDKKIAEAQSPEQRKVLEKEKKHLKKDMRERPSPEMEMLHESWGKIQILGYSR